jgi:hypothetical protein
MPLCRIRETVEIIVVELHMNSFQLCDLCRQRPGIVAVFITARESLQQDGLECEVHRFVNTTALED